MKSQLVILGGGPGGYAAAFLAADLGMNVALVDMEARLGGVCLLRGCIPSKALLHVAKSMAEARHLAEWGVAFAPPAIDITAMRARKERVIATLTGGLKQLAAKRKVQVIRARATFENSQTLRLHAVGDKPLEDDRLEFEHCILATGSSPTQIPGLLGNGPVGAVRTVGRKDVAASETGTAPVAAASVGNSNPNIATGTVPVSAPVSRVMD